MPWQIRQTTLDLLTPKRVRAHRVNGRPRGTESLRLPARRPRYQQLRPRGLSARPVSRGLRHQGGTEDEQHTDVQAEPVRGHREGQARGGLRPMARRATGRVIEHQGSDGLTYRALRFTAYGKRRYRLARSGHSDRGRARAAPRTRRCRARHLAATASRRSATRAGADPDLSRVRGGVVGAD